ncbi:tetratricopeptide repeat protein, partial [Candidatus Woesearchaeota archaeon]|nr:tetratricopeptide repeat protein [Candidatus Woesearchaeota archaeon]
AFANNFLKWSLVSLVLAFGSDIHAQKTSPAVKAAKEVTFAFKNPLPEKSRRLEGVLEEMTNYYEKGVDHFYKGELDKADSYFTKALSNFPEFSEAHYYRGLISAKKNRNNEAISNLKKSVDFFGGNLEAHIALAEAYRNSKDTKKAKMHFNAAVEIFSQDNRPYTGLAGIALSEGKLELAKEMADSAIARNPYDAEAYRIIGDFFAKNNNEGTAYTNYRIANALNPCLGIKEEDAFGKDGKLEVSVLKTIESVNKPFNEKTIAFNLEMCMSECVLSHFYSNKSLIKDMADIELFRLKDMIKKNPFNVRMRDMLSGLCIVKAQSLEEKGKTDEAVWWYERSIANDLSEINIAPSAYTIYNLCNKKGSTDKAAYFARLAIQTLSRTMNRENAIGSSGMLSELLENYPAALWFMTKNETEGLMDIYTAFELIDNKKYDEAIPIIENVLNSHCFKPMVRGLGWGGAAKAYSDLGLYDKAMKAAEKSIDAYPSGEAGIPAYAQSLVNKGADVYDIMDNIIIYLMMRPDFADGYKSMGNLFIEKSESRDRKDAVENHQAEIEEQSAEILFRTAKEIKGF